MKKQKVFKSGEGFIIVGDEEGEGLLQIFKYILAKTTEDL